MCPQNVAKDFLNLFAFQLTLGTSFYKFQSNLRIVNDFATASAIKSTLNSNISDQSIILL